MACQKDGHNFSVGDECTTGWTVVGVGVVRGLSGAFLFCPGVVTGECDVLARLGSGCSIEGGSLCLVVDGCSSSDVSKSPQLVIWEKEMSNRTWFVDVDGPFRICWFG